jgi:MFS family permease
MFEDYKGIPRQARFLVYAQILPALASGMLFTDLSFFLTEVQGIPGTYMGWILTAMGLSMVLMAIPMGIAADRFGRKRVWIIGNVFASLGIAVFALTTNLVFLFGAAVMEGVSDAADSASSSALMADLAGDEKRTSAFSLSGFFSSIASGIGSFIIPFIVVFEALGFSNKESHVVIYIVVAAALSLLSTAFVLKIGEVKPYKSGVKVFLLKKSRGVLAKYVLANSILAAGAGLFIPIMSHWFYLKYGIPDSISVPILGVSSILIGISSLAAPILARRLGIVKAIIATQGVSMVFMIATPLAPQFSTASIVYTFRNFLMNMAGPLQSSMIMGLVPPDERGAAAGISSALWRLPNSFSVSIGTWLLNENMLSAPFYVAAVLYTISISLFYSFFHRIRMPEERSKIENDT